MHQLFSEANGAPRIELSFKCSDRSRLPQNIDDEILRRLEPLLRIAERRGIRMALYPHSFYPLESLAAARALSRRLDPAVLGYVFATSHVFAIASASETLGLLQEHARAIASFNVCGCRRLAPRPPAKCVHFPPDEGDLDIAALLRILSGENYRGDIIVQGHGWTGNLHSMLRRSAQFLKSLT